MVCYPINNVCVPFKILEKCVSSQLSDHLDMNRIMTDTQHGFRKGLSSDTAVTELTRKLFDDKNNCNISSCPSLDFSRTVDHAIILLSKLAVYGVHSDSLR